MDNRRRTRVVGDYILGPRIGSGSFAVVWKAWHRFSGLQVAVKEIDKQSLSSKLSENLLKEISILSTIDHPNIVRLFDSIETKERIFLVLEYCDGGDLSEYIHRHGKVSEAVAKHFLRQLAAGLQVLQDKHVIHRDLKPQNLFLLSNERTPQLKIGDFGFARPLTPQDDLAKTVCGSPLYMAPEVFDDRKYDAKADLWSVGAILFQLVTGKPPFHGNSQYQLFQNILTSTELRFPQGALEELHPDCVDLCRSLLRQNPVERLTFNEFFNHKFLGESRLIVDAAEQSSLAQEIKSVVEHSSRDKGSQCYSELPACSANRNTELTSSSVHDIVLHGKFRAILPGTHVVHDRMEKSVDGNQHVSDQPRVSDSMESIEKGYVIVNCNSASMENFSYYSETSLQDNSATRVSVCPTECAAGSVRRTENPVGRGSEPLATSCTLSISNEAQSQSTLQWTMLHLLHRYAQAIAEVAEEKNNTGLFLESFSVELVVLAIWKKALKICSSRLSTTVGSELPGCSSANESAPVQGRADVSGPLSACDWAEQEFVAAYERAEKLSHRIQDSEGTAEMPDAMEIIFKKALTLGTSGAVDEYMRNKGSAAVSYSKAKLLLSFVAEEADSLPLNPPFLLTPAIKNRIQCYITNLQNRQSHF